MASPFDRFGLNAREQRLAQILSVVLAVAVLLGLPVLVQGIIWSRKSDNDKTRTALEAVQAARKQIREQQAKKNAVVSRYQNKAPALAGFIEQAARAQKLEVTDSADRPEVPIGKRYTERATNVKLKKSGMYAIAKFLEALETSDHPVAVTRLNVRKRSTEKDSFDLDLTVSAYDRKEPPAPAPAASGAASGAKPSKDKPAKESP
jgi:general secretion pathway protein M